MATPVDGAGKRVIIGRITGVHGIKGWLKLFSYTEPRENIFSYHPWLIGKAGEKDGAWTEIDFSDSGKRGKALVVKFVGVEDRDNAGRFVHCPIAVYRERMPEPAAGEYYWADLLELDVITVTGRRLGKIVDIRETGANDVLIVQGENRCAIPFVKNEIVKIVDPDRGVIEVEWPWD